MSEVWFSFFWKKSFDAASVHWKAWRSMVQEDRDQMAERWLSQYGDYLYRYALSRVRDASHAEDLIQETLIIALQKIDTFQGRSSEKTWLTGILRYRMLDHYRKQSRDWRFPVAGEGPDGGWFDEEGHWNRAINDAGMEWEPDPSGLLDRKEFMEVLHACIQQLPDKAAAVFVQRELEFEKTSTILEVLNISESNLWVLLHRARNMLKLCIQSKWDTEAKSGGNS
ncbi:MAG: sigma-70 family RNA polymerase sigma factor [Verrucomicrobia bacterium]|nr:sigma-70 family RNA polymerase sigma factor [Verrucomicrobiota bacterium]